MSKPKAVTWVVVVSIAAILLYIWWRNRQKQASAANQQDMPGLTDSNGVTATADAMGRYYVNGREAIKCCQARDLSCHCTKWKWAAAADCASVACGGTGNNALITYNVEVSAMHTHPVETPNNAAGNMSTPRSGNASLSSIAAGKV